MRPLARSEVLLQLTDELVFWVGDNGPLIDVFFVFETNEPVDVTVAPYYFISRKGGTTVLSTGQLSVVDGPAGHARVNLGSFSFSTPGEYLMQCEIVLGSERLSTQVVPITVLRGTPTS